MVLFNVAISNWASKFWDTHCTIRIICQPIELTSHPCPLWPVLIKTLFIYEVFHVTEKFEIRGKEWRHIRVDNISVASWKTRRQE